MFVKDHFFKISLENMRTVSPEFLATLQKNPKNIRHICILAHVDHGKYEC